MHSSYPIVLGMLLALSPLSANAHAQSTLTLELMSIQDLRDRLADYQPDELPAVIAELTAMLEPGASMAVRDEARWLRAAAAVDALIVSAGVPEPAYQTALAQAYRVDAASLRGAIRADLEYLRRGNFAIPARRALASLDATGPSAQAGAGLGADALWLQELANDIASGTDHQQVLARHFDRVSAPPTLNGIGFARILRPDSRSAVRTLMGATEAYSRFQEALTEGAPVTRHLEAPVAHAWATISSVRLTPHYQLSDEHRVTTVSNTVHTTESRPELIVHLTPSTVSYAIAPTIGIDADDGVDLIPSPHPTYPSMSSFPLPQNLQRAAVPLDAVTDLLRLADLPSGDWALAVDPDVDSLLLAQTLIAANAAPERDVMLLGRSNAGRTMTIAIGLLPMALEELPRSQVRVTVARQGYRVHSIWGSAQLPTVVREGRSSHDRDRLDRTLEPFAIQSALLRFRDNVRAEAITDAIWSIAPEEGPVLLLAESTRTN